MPFFRKWDSFFKSPNLPKKLFQKTIVSLKFEIPTHKSLNLFYARVSRISTMIWTYIVCTWALWLSFLLNWNRPDPEIIIYFLKFLSGLTIICGLVTSHVRSLKFCGAKVKATEILTRLAKKVASEIIMDRILPFVVSNIP